jgi:carbazole 1,9a-dioxygenase terminal dioxygenase component
MVSEKELERELADETRDYLEEIEMKKPRRRPWQQWLKASLGFRNYWYPAALSRDIGEKNPKKVQILGEEILLIRQEGRLYGIEDRCTHRGVRFSKRPLCYTMDTITCWYHTFTYNLDDGTLRCILNEPNSPLVGKIGIKTYPVREVKGIVFLFVGDIEPPDLACDVPPGFLDKDMALYLAEPREVKSNWRLACENGFDPGHHFIHNWSRFVLSVDFPMSFGFVSKRGKEHEVVEYVVNEPGPKGFYRYPQVWELIFEATIPGRRPGDEGVKVVAPGIKGKDMAQISARFETAPFKLGLWLPCGLVVENTPFPGITHFEFYVPKDEHSHIYFQFGGKRVNSPEDAEEWTGEEGYRKYEVNEVNGFTAEDIFAREALEKFYSEEDGWYRERLYRPDVEITMWRKFASEHARGIQTVEHVKGLRR